MPIELRAITEDELPEFHHAEGTAFGNVDASEAALDHERAVMEFDRTIAGFDDGRIVSTAGAYSFEMTVPGGLTVPVAAVTAVSVMATHRRKGILREMMAHQLDDVVARGEPIAILNASEAGIYGRFGYGLAQFYQSWKLDTIRCGFRAPVRDDVVLQLIPKADAGPRLKPIYDTWRRTRAGAIAHSDGWWSCLLGDYESWRGGGKAFVVVCDPADDGSHAGGYVIYTIEQKGPPGSWRAIVRDMVVSDPVVHARLWRFLLDIDLVGVVVAPVVPLDDPLRWQLDDPRQVQTTDVRDFLYIRILDVQRALATRRYHVEDAITFEVHDTFRPDSQGRYRLAGGPDGATCERVGDRDVVDLELDAADLGSLYLGGVLARDLAATGRITERSPGAIARADRFFTWPVAPFCLTRF